VRNAADSVGGAASSLRDEQSPLGATLGEVRGFVQRLQSELTAAGVAETTGALRNAGDAMAGLGRDVQTELAQLRRTLVAIEQLMTTLERDPGALLRGRPPAGSPLEEGKR
jgi:hypothetical protein